MNPNNAHQKGNEFSKYKLLTAFTTAILRFSRSDFCLAFGILSVTIIYIYSMYRICHVLWTYL